MSGHPSGAPHALRVLATKACLVGRDCQECCARGHDEKEDHHVATERELLGRILARRYLIEVFSKDGLLDDPEKALPGRIVRTELAATGKSFGRGRYSEFPIPTASCLVIAVSRRERPYAG